VKKKSLVGWACPDILDYFRWWRHRFGEWEVDCKMIAKRKDKRMGLIKVRITIEELTPVERKER